MPWSHKAPSRVDRMNTPTSKVLPTHYYTVGQVAARFQTGREQVHRWIRSGKLRCIRVGKLVRISAEALAESEEAHLAG